jgi:hypothetical protein
MGDGIRASAFEVRQRFKLSTNVYEVRADGVLVAWARQKIMAVRERIEVWTDESKGELLCAVQARKKLDVHGGFDVTDGAGAQLAVLRKQFRQSLLRSTWTIETPAGEPLATVTESSAAVALVRRVKAFVDLIPFIGWLLALIPLPYHFTWLAPDGSRIGSYDRVLGVRELYRLDVTGDPQHRIDRRVVIALAICLDALQSR